MKLSGARIIMECLLEQGVDTVFGYPGSTILAVYDELYRYRSKIRHILTSHEQGAAHAADGYARATGKPGVCFATSGPGATNLITGMATAFMDSSPVVFITCNVSEDMMGKDSFQEVDIIGISMPITKCNYLVSSADEMADVMREAFAIACSGRPGPVLIDVPKDVALSKAEFEFVPKSEQLARGCLPRLERRIAQLRGRMQEDDIETLVKMLAEAERPVILAGGGVIIANAAESLAAFAEKLDIPVATTLMGIGSISAESALSIGMAGMHGAKTANFAVANCDLLLALGVRFSDRVTGDARNFAPKAKIVHVDIDKSEIDKNVVTAHSIHGSVRKVLKRLLEKTESGTHSAWRAEIEAKREKKTPLPGGFTPADIISVIRETAGKDATIVTDVGQHQMWTAMNFPVSKPRQLITSGGFGAMGFGLGAAIGAKIGDPSRTVVHITGDGCFRMNSNELATEEHYGAAVITVVFNNGTLGMVRQWQRLKYKGRYSCSTLDRGPDFVKLAEAYGVAGYRAENTEELYAALNSALASGKGAVIDCAVDIDEQVAPMATREAMDEYMID